MKPTTLITLIVSILTSLGIVLGAGIYIGKNQTINSAQDENIRLLSLSQRETGAQLSSLTKAVDQLIRSGTPFRLNDAERLYNESRDKFYQGDKFWLAYPTHEDVNRVQP
jgi:hypothetical protein